MCASDFGLIAMANRHLNEGATRLLALIRSKLLLSQPRALTAERPLPWFVSVVPLAVFFIFGFFNALTEGGWAGLGLTIGITALFIAAYAARPPH